MNAERARLSQVMRILGQAADVLQSGAASVEADPASFYSTGSGGAS